MVIYVYIQNDKINTSTRDSDLMYTTQCYYKRVNNVSILKKISYIIIKKVSLVSKQYFLIYLINFIFHWHFYLNEKLFATILFGSTTCTIFANLFGSAT